MKFRSGPFCKCNNNAHMAFFAVFMAMMRAILIIFLITFGQLYFIGELLSVEKFHYCIEYRIPFPLSDIVLLLLFHIHLPKRISIEALKEYSRVQREKEDILKLFNITPKHSIEELTYLQSLPSIDQAILKPEIFCDSLFFLQYILRFLISTGIPILSLFCTPKRYLRRRRT